MTTPDRERVWKRLTREEIRAICPVRGDGTPDTYNHLPTRFITQEEAFARGWVHFYIGDVCSYGHKAPRFASSPGVCVDCRRLQNGRQTIGGKGEPEFRQHTGGRRPRATVTPTGAVVVATRSPVSTEPDALEKKFLTAYAQLRDFDKAAAELRRSPADFQARLSYSKPFRDAIDFLEDQYGLCHTASLTDDFEWTDEKRAVLIRIYINTGDLNEALHAIGCSNWHFEAEMNDNHDFAKEMDRIEPIANKVIERIGIGKAIHGDSRLLQKVMSAKLPDYSERVKIDMNVTDRLSDAQLDQRILLMFEQLGGRVIESTAQSGEFEDTESDGQGEPPEDDGGEVPPSTSESNSDLL